MKIFKEHFLKFARANFGMQDVEFISLIKNKNFDSPNCENKNYDTLHEISLQMLNQACKNKMVSLLTMTKPIPIIIAPTANSLQKV